MDKKSISSVSDNVKEILHSVRQAAIECGRSPDEIAVMAVTKNVDTQRVNEAIDSGIHLLGENRVQELLEKYDDYKKEGVEIHFIGHLQTNKVKQIIDKVSMIHSVDSLRLAQEIDRQAKRIGIVMKVLVEVNIGEEESKFGVSAGELPQFLQEISKLPNLSVEGLMAIPPITSSAKESEYYFHKMSNLFIDIKQKNVDNISMGILSMGMSKDYLYAIKYGSHIVRIGTAMFGFRS